MPLSSIQSDILRLIASQLNPESYVAGAAPLNLDGKRFSSDVDIFHDREDRVASSALEIARILESAGYTIEWLRRLPSIYTADVIRGDERTRLEWVVDSDFRFFPTLRDETFGYVLHPVDLAVNKVMAAAGRREVRDLVDLVEVQENILPLGALVWAAVEKSPGFTPEGLIAEIRRNSHHPAAEWRVLETVVPLDPKTITQRLSIILAEADTFVSKMPSSKAGLLFLKEGKVVQPDPGNLDAYQTHAGMRRGHWPDSPEIANAMIEEYLKDRPKAGESER